MNRINTKSNRITRIVVTTILVLCSVMMMLPLYYLLITSFKTLAEAIGPFTWWPQTWTLGNFKEIFEIEWFQIGRFFGNTMFIVLVKSRATMITCSLVAYGFVRYRYKYKEVFFAILMGALLIPGELLTIPQYEIYIKLGWMDTYYPMTVSCFFATDIFAIFLFRQFFGGVPTDLFEAARVDGCSEWRAFWNIMLPLTKPVFVTLFLLYFIGTYNDVYSANLYLLSEDKYTIAQGLQMIQNMFNNGARDHMIPWNTLSAATLVAITPVIALFAVGQKQFIEGMATTGIKG